MAFELPQLPYDMNALEPHISKRTLEFHYGKHHKAYVDKLNSLVEGTAQASKSLEDLIRESEGGVFNNAAQVWNHTFYWNGMSALGGGEPSSALKSELEKNFGSVEEFKNQVTNQGLGLFGSGWTWLIKDSDGSLKIHNESNAGNPLRVGKTPLLTVDVWEHAYYLDYQNARKGYLDNFWNLINWQFIEDNLEKS
ncbi:MAG: superoxide dismutase [Fe] [Deltaproteobacteria bacterium]|nr:superoxide dismutase [Fe] [Deltaproteobacteria bacterium]